MSSFNQVEYAIDNLKKSQKDSLERAANIVKMLADILVDSNMKTLQDVKSVKSTCDGAMNILGNIIRDGEETQADIHHLEKRVSSNTGALVPPTDNRQEIQPTVSEDGTRATITGANGQTYTVLCRSDCDLPRVI